MERRDFLGARLEDIRYTGQAAEFRVQPRMLFPKMSYTYHRDSSHKNRNTRGTRSTKTLVPFVLLVFLSFSLHCNNRSTLLIRDPNQFISINHQCLSCLDRQSRGL